MGFGQVGQSYQYNLRQINKGVEICHSKSKINGLLGMRGSFGLPTDTFAGIITHHNKAISSKQ